MQPIDKVHACRQGVAETKLQKISSAVMQQRKKNFESKYIIKKGQLFLIHSALANVMSCMVVLQKKQTA